MSSGRAIDILRACTAHPSALVVVTAVTGGTMREPGALMAVGADGTVTGYVSNGCVDADIAARAAQILHSGQGEPLVYGAGSPFRDISLPCGGRIEVVILPPPEPSILTECVTRLSARQATEIFVSPDYGLALQSGDATFRTVLQPALCLRIAGRGAAIAALARLGRASGFEMICQSPDAGDGVQHLIHPDSIPPVRDDPRTAVVTLFHDHAWEPPLLAQALNGPAFYVGAMGSQRSHDLRLEQLRALGVSDAQAETIRAPIGLVGGLRDADSLAISILAEILAAAKAKGL